MSDLKFNPQRITCCTKAMRFCKDHGLEKFIPNLRDLYFNVSSYHTDPVLTFHQLFKDNQTLKELYKEKWLEWFHEEYEAYRKQNEINISKQFQKMLMNSFYGSNTYYDAASFALHNSSDRYSYITSNWKDIFEEHLSDMHRLFDSLPRY